MTLVASPPADPPAAMINDNSYHTPVLRDAVCRYLVTAKDGVYVDATLGGGGHAESILETLSPEGKLIGIDKDADAVEFARRKLQHFGKRAVVVHEDFSNLRLVLASIGIEKVNGLLLDLGVSSHQLDEADRGFSFRYGENRLDMRMDRSQQLDGWSVVNTYNQEKLADLFWKFGEERFSRRIAGAIVRQRGFTTIDTTGALVQIIQSVVGKQYIQKSLARIFQAIRIEVNAELDHLAAVLSETLEVVCPGGRMVVISYHSLEDRIVKDFMKYESSTSIASGNKYIPDQQRSPRLRVLTRKPIEPDNDEMRCNSRARSAKLRAAERL